MANFEYYILIIVIYAILIITSLYLLIEYIRMNIKLNKLLTIVNNRNSLGYVYAENKYDPILFEQLLLSALSVLRNNINTITIPYFYTKTIEDIIKIIPLYINVIKFIKYINDHPDTQNDAIQIALQKNYGIRYTHSDKILIPVTISISQFHNYSHKHSILTDLTKAQHLYEKNIETINKILKQ